MAMINGIAIFFFYVNQGRKRPKIGWKTKYLTRKTPSESQKQRPKSPLKIKNEDLRLNQHVCFLQSKIVKNCQGLISVRPMNLRYVLIGHVTLSLFRMIKVSRGRQISKCFIYIGNNVIRDVNS